MGAPMAMIAAVVLLSELRPIVMTRLPGNPVSISLAFVFATLYIWGLYPALVLQAAAVVLSEIVARKTAVEDPVQRGAVLDQRDGRLAGDARGRGGPDPDVADTWA